MTNNNSQTNILWWLEHFESKNDIKLKLDLAHIIETDLLNKGIGAIKLHGRRVYECKEWASVEYRYNFNDLATHFEVYCMSDWRLCIANESKIVLDAKKVLNQTRYDIKYPLILYDEHLQLSNETIIPAQILHQNTRRIFYDGIEIRTYVRGAWEKIVHQLAPHPIKY